jgi:hypothetical protein
LGSGLILFLIGGSLFSTSGAVSVSAVARGKTRIWTVETTVEFNAGEKAMPVKATPHPGPDARLRGSR